jgi:glutathione-regulated potassium-efflux system ancillary protein KefC
MNNRTVLQPPDALQYNDTIRGLLVQSRPRYKVYYIAITALLGYNIGQRFKILIMTNEELNQSFVVGLLMAAAGILALELGFSAAVFEILAGFLARNVIGIWDAPWLKFIADFGLISLMFIAGFEVDLPMLGRNLVKSLVIGGLSYIIPFAGAFGLSLLLGMNFEKAVIISICMSTTSLALVFPVLREKGILTSPPGQLLLSSAMIVDIASVITLIAFFVTPGPRLYIGAALILAVLIVGPFLSKWLFGRWKGNVIEMEVRLILFALLTLMFIASMSEVHTALTGFIFGAVMASVLRKHFQVEEKVRNVVFSFFAPVFFFRAGTQMDISTFSWSNILVILVFLPNAFLLKLAGTYYPFRWFKCNLAKFAAILFNYRLSFAIVAALFGLQAGQLTAGEYSAVMTIVLIASIGVALVLRFDREVDKQLIV